MKEHSKKRNIEETMDNSSVPQETVCPRADSFDSLGSFGLLLKKMPLPEEGEDIMFSPQELELKEIEAQFKSDMSNLKNNRNKKLFNLFASSLKNNDTETCKKIINSDGFDINTQDDTGHTALHYSSRLGNSEMTKILLDKGADLKIKGANGNTALHISTCFDHNDNNKVLVDEAKKNNLNNIFDDKNNRGFTPLNFSASNTFINAIKSRNSTEIENTYNRVKDDVLLDFQDEDGNTALHHATANDDYHTAKLLLENGANANIKNMYEQTPKDLVIKQSRVTFGLLFGNNNLQNGPKSQQR